MQEQVFSENDAFFAWTFMKRQTLWQTIISFLWPLVALAVCLFPVYPYRCKIVVLYSCAGALLLLVSLIFCKSHLSNEFNHLVNFIIINFIKHVFCNMKCKWIIKISGTIIIKRALLLPHTIFITPLPLLVLQPCCS